MSKEFVSPAFPVPGLNDDEDFNGLSKREYFAGKAMQSLIGAMLGDKDMCGPDGGPVTEAVIAAQACYFADAMLAELAK